MNARLLSIGLAVAMVVVLAVVLLARPGSGGDELDLSDQPQLGPADAPVSIAVFEDFRCPHCATFTETIKPRLERDLVASGEAALYAVSFPILGPASRDAAAVAECAAEQGDDAFWGLQPVLMRSQDRLNGLAAALAIARDYASFADLDVEALEACVDAGRGYDAADADAELGQSLGLQSTPSVLVDGDRVDATYDAIVAAVRGAR